MGDKDNILGESIFKKTFAKDDFLWGNIEKYVKSSKSIKEYEGVSVTDERVYISNQFNFKDAKLDDGRYIILIIYENGNRKIEIKNMFIKLNDLYKFSVNDIYKTF